ncbi:hypothetical protein OHB35_23325 [Streptomyces phaeochromogenes]|uniref:DUF11 domain-containing protein n=1 Tax=Streptomyces phaeochromogenes TaxID=1923 RepID=A0ABZ1HBH7_STRPH|nr:hypothetical protein [Streptomyces phaeochromogenes]WSD15942.1 hypothetical protein OHB35_23325 [Streptomyces phaeochromogenes]
MRPDSVRRALRLGACAGAMAGLLTVGLALPAAADEPETDQLWISAPYEQGLPLGTDGGEPQARTLDLGMHHENSNFTVTDGRLTVDVSGLAGVAEVTWPDTCTPSGTTAVCVVPDVPVVGEGDHEQIQLEVRAADGATGGARGRITYEATATGGPDGVLVAESSATTLTVASGPDLSIRDEAPVGETEPGTTETIPFALSNKGNEAANGFTLTMYASYGLDFVSTYSECEYTDVVPVAHATCTFDEVLAPGESFELPEPLKVAIEEHAFNERLDLSVEPGGGATDLWNDDNYVALQIGAANTADFAVRGAAVSGAAGDTVTARIAFRNKGPAWVGNLGSGEPVASVDLRVPEGTTVTGVPSGCYPLTLDGGYFPGSTGAPRYVCNLPYWVSESAKRTYAFKLRVDVVVPGASGAVVVRPEREDGFPFDPDGSNNSARLVVN